MSRSASECDRSFVVELLFPTFVSVSPAVEEAGFGFGGPVGGFWTTISVSLGFVGLNVKAGEALLA